MTVYRFLPAALYLASCALVDETVSPLASGLGHDLRATQGSNWTIEDGVLIPERGDARTYVITDRRYANVEISLEFFPAAGTNSGVFARCRDAELITPIDCYEFNIWDAHPNRDARTGAVVMIKPPIADVATEDRWNSMRIRLEGTRLRAWINGTLVNDVRHDELTEGHIAFQYGGENGMVRFRDIRITPL